MLKLVISFSINWVFLQIVSAQTFDSSGKFLGSASSPKGIYIYVLDEQDLAGKDSAIASNTSSFIIEKYLANSDTTKRNFEALTTFTFKGVSTVSDLNSLYTPSQIKDLKKLLRLSSDEVLAQYFSTRKLLNDYQLLYKFIETKQAAGHVYLDKDVKPGENYFYRVYRVDKDNNKTVWGFTFKKAASGNYLLPHFKPQLKDVFSTDSAVSVTWKMPVSVNLLAKINPPVSDFGGDESGYLYRMPFSPLSTRANVFIAEGDKSRKISTLLPSLNSTYDTLTYSYFQPLLPGRQLVVFLQTEDEVYNPGINSDTAYAFTVDRKTVPMLKVIRVADVVNGVQISWDKIDVKPYMQAIEIIRYNSQDKKDSLALLPVTDTIFTDYKVELGQTYRYEAKLIYNSSVKLTQEIPAQGTGRFTKFSRPMPVVNLTIKNVNKLPVLTWDAPIDPSFYGAFIYRGTSAKELDLIAGPVKTNTFTDSAENVTGRNEYFYAVVNQNLRQDTSVFSDIVSILPDKKIETSAPSTIDFYYANDTLRISWNDVRANDNAIEKFLVMRSTGKENSYKPVGNGFTLNNYIMDNDMHKGKDYNYKVAAVSVRGDTSEFSEPYTYSVMALPIPQVDLYYVRSITEGVQISLPTVINEGRNGYNIYRREATAEEFTKIGFIKEGDFTFLDKDVKDNVIYVYGISIVTNEDKEGARGKSISIRYTKNEN